MIVALTRAARGLVLIKLHSQCSSLTLLRLPRALASFTTHSLVLSGFRAQYSHFLPTSSVISSLQLLFPHSGCVCGPSLTFSPPPFLPGSNTISHPKLLVQLQRQILISLPYRFSSAQSHHPTWVLPWLEPRCPIPCHSWKFMPVTFWHKASLTHSKVQVS